MTTKIPAPSAQVIRPSVPMVKQATLRDVVDARSVIESLKRDLKQHEDALMKMEETLKARVVAGARVEDGALAARVVTTKRRTVPWRAVVERELGIDFAEKEMATIEPTVTTHLVVEPAPRREATA